MQNQVVTNLHDRAELMKRLDKAEQQVKNKKGRYISMYILSL